MQKFVGVPVSHFSPQPFNPDVSHFSTALMGKNIDATKILFGLPPEGWKKPRGSPHITLLKTVENEFPLNEALALWRLLAMFSATHMIEDDF